jgi:hypothetical protein
MNAPDPLTRARALLGLAAITLVGGALRFYNLGWGAPYFQFHIDEHFVFVGADNLRDSMEKAALAPKFFMYAPLPMHLLNVVRAIYEAVAHPLVLTVPRDEVTYMLLGRGISAGLGTATIPVAYAIAARLANRTAALLAAAFAALAVLHLRESHFFSVDVSMVFFVMLTWLALFRMVSVGDVRSGLLVGVSFGSALACKYSAVFMAVPIALAHLLSPHRPAWPGPAGAWGRWALRGAVPVLACVITFFALDPMVLLYYAKFRDDVRTLITEPLSGMFTERPVWQAHFTGVSNLRLYWFTNLLWWGLGPALEIWSIAGVVWLLLRRTRLALMAVSVPAAYYAIAGGSVAPFVRYAVPLGPILAVTAGVFSADLLRRPRWRLVGAVATVGVLVTTALYAAAYMNVFRQMDSRVAAARYLKRAVPAGARILVEPSQILPPMGDYFENTNFYASYQPTGARGEYRWHFHLFVLDTYRYLFDTPLSDAEKRAYIAARLAEVDWVILEDSFVEFYADLPSAKHGAVKDYHADMAAGRLGFDLVRTFKVYPSLFGWDIDDDRSELTFRLFDHPRISVYKRR